MDFVLAANANNPYRTHNSPQPRPISVPVDPSVLTLARRILAACWVHVTEADMKYLHSSDGDMDAALRDLAKRVARRFAAGNDALYQSIRPLIREIAVLHWHLDSVIGKDPLVDQPTRYLNDDGDELWHAAEPTADLLSQIERVVAAQSRAFAHYEGAHERKGD